MECEKNTFLSESVFFRADTRLFIPVDNRIPGKKAAKCNKILLFFTFRQCVDVYDEKCETKYPAKCTEDQSCTMVYQTKCDTVGYSQKCQQVN